MKNKEKQNKIKIKHIRKEKKIINKNPRKNKTIQQITKEKKTNSIQSNKH